MKADIDETIENIHEDLQLSGDLKVFTESTAQKPEVPAPTEVEIKNFHDELSTCKTKPIVVSLVPPYADSYTCMCCPVAKSRT